MKNSTYEHRLFVLEFDVYLWITFDLCLLDVYIFTTLSPLYAFASCRLSSPSTFALFFVVSSAFDSLHAHTKGCRTCRFFFG